MINAFFVCKRDIVLRAWKVVWRRLKTTRRFIYPSFSVVPFTGNRPRGRSVQDLIVILTRTSLRSQFSLYRGVFRGQSSALVNSALNFSNRQTLIIKCWTYTRSSKIRKVKEMRVSLTFSETLSERSSYSIGNNRLKRISRCLAFRSC